MRSFLHTTAMTQPATERSAVRRSTSRKHRGFVHRGRDQSADDHALQGAIQAHRALSGLRVGQPGDRYEREADHIANETIRSSKNGPAGVSHRLGGERSHRHGVLDRLGLGSGHPLDAETRSYFASRFGRDVDHVRVHTDTRSADVAAGLASRAFTIGSHIVFGSGEFEPHTSRGRWLLAHELAHTVQQRAGRPGVPVVQRAPIPDDSPLADYLNWTQQAIDDLAAGSPETLSPQALPILQGLRNRIGLRDSNGTMTRRARSFRLAARTLPGQSRAVDYTLVVDDQADPPRGAQFQGTAGGGGVITVFAEHFRGNDHTAIGSALFHEAVHALFHLRRTFPRIRFAAEAERAIDPTRHAHFTRLIHRDLDRLLPGDARIPRVVEQLLEEILVIVETQAYEISVQGYILPHHSGGMRAALHRSLFAGHMLNAADEAIIRADSYKRRILSEMLARIDRYLEQLVLTRVRRIGVYFRGMHIRPIPGPPPSPPTLPRRSFIPELLETVETGPL